MESSSIGSNSLVLATPDKPQLMPDKGIMSDNTKLSEDPEGKEVYAGNSIQNGMKSLPVGTGPVTGISTQQWAALSQATPGSIGQYDYQRLSYDLRGGLYSAGNHVNFIATNSFKPHSTYEYMTLVEYSKNDQYLCSSKPTTVNDVGNSKIDVCSSEVFPRNQIPYSSNTSYGSHQACQNQHQQGAFKPLESKNITEGRKRKKTSKANKAKGNPPEKRHKLFEGDELGRTDPCATADSTYVHEPDFTNVTKRDQFIARRFAPLKGRITDVTKEDFIAAIRAFNNRSVRGKEAGWLIKGMRVNLYDHQLLGAGGVRMLDRGPAKGGILADQMGFGKSVEMMANIVDGLKDSDCKKGADTTLIVVPQADLVRQWEQEFEKFLDPEKDFPILALDSTSGNGFSSFGAVVKKQRVVLTTYKRVIKSYRSLPASESHVSDQQARRRKSTVIDTTTLLHTFHFHRVVLDECQAIKNHLSQAAQACRAIKATRRWLMTGTPLQDSVEELASYFMFLKVPGVSDLRAFNRKFKCEDSIWTPELKNQLSQLMIRRTSKSTLLSQPIFKIPKARRKETIFVSLKAEESAWYTSLESRVSNSINAVRHRKDIGEKEKKERIMMWFQRLSQMRTHPLLACQILAELSRDEIQGRGTLKDLLKSCSRSPVTDFQLDGMIRFIKKVGDKYTQYQDAMDELKSQIADLKQKQRETKEAGSDRKLADITEFIETEKKKLRKLRSEPPRFHHKRWLKTTGDVLIGSSLLSRVEAEFELLQVENPGCKVVIFTQFVDVADILQKIFEHRGWKTVQYHGSVNPPRRRKNLERFQGEEGVLALISTPKSGGVGLNLTVASRVMLLDSWWNEAVDDQAAARVHRLGQTRETEILKFAVNGTIDEKIKRIQDRKSTSIDMVLNGASVGSEKGFFGELADEIQAKSLNAVDVSANNKAFGAQTINNGANSNSVRNKVAQERDSHDIDSDSDSDSDSNSNSSTESDYNDYDDDSDYNDGGHSK